MTPFEYAALPEELEPAGLPETRDAIADFLSVATEAVAVTAGGAAAITSCFMYVNYKIAERLRILAPRPFYPQYKAVASLLGAEFETYRVSEDGIDFDSLTHGSATVRPHLIVVNSPHNPTGSTISENDLLKTLGIAGDNAAIIMFDETFRGLEYGASPVDLPQPTPGFIRISSMGKKFPALSDSRTGYIVADPVELSDLAVVHRGIAVGASVHAQQAAIQALHDDPHATLYKNAQQLKAALNQLRPIEESTPLQVSNPRGGIFSRISIPQHLDPHTFSTQLRKQFGFWCNPAHTHGCPDEKWIRFRLALPCDELARRIQQLTDFVGQGGCNVSGD